MGLSYGEKPTESRREPSNKISTGRMIYREQVRLLWGRP